MQDIHDIDVKSIVPDPQQPRKRFDDSETGALSENMKAIGQRVPVIVYPGNSTFMLCDGERRWRAAQMAGIETLLALVLPTKPNALELRRIQLSLELHKVGISTWEKSCSLKQIRDESGCSIAELAVNVNLRQPIVSKLLGCQRLDKAIQQLVHSGTLDLEKAFIISQEPDFGRQREMVKLYAHLPREQFRQKTKRAAASKQASVKRARFYLAGGASVIVHGTSLTLADAIACLLETVKQLKRGQAQSKDIVETQNEMRRKARTNHVVVEENRPAG
jgi:ParB/RepB/Spo0J family partition protein